MFTLLQFRVLQTAAHLGSLSTAARHLNRSVSAISMTLKQLEERVGGPLFEGDRKSALTRLGKFILDETGPLLEHHDRIIEAIQNYVDSSHVRLDIACVPSVAATFMPQALASLWERNPKLSIHARDMDSRSVAEAVALGTVEIGIASLLEPRSDLVFSPLFSDPLDLVCCESDPLCGQDTPVSWKAISERHFLSNGSYFAVESKQFNEIDAKRRMHIPNVISLLAAVQAGIGVTVLPRLIGYSTTSKVRFLPLADKNAYRTVYTIQRKGRPTSAITARFLLLLREILKRRRLDFDLKAIAGN